MELPAHPDLPDESGTIESRHAAPDKGPGAEVKGNLINVHSIRDAKRLLSRIIREVQKDAMDGKKARELTYLLSTFVQITRQSDFETRLLEIEKKLTLDFSAPAGEK